MQLNSLFTRLTKTWQTTSSLYLSQMKYTSTYHPQFITATILEWKHLLKDDSFKEIIISSLQFLYKEGSIIVYAFVIMPNHIHMIRQIQDGYVQDKIQQRFLKFTGQQMKFKMIDERI